MPIYRIDTDNELEVIYPFSTAQQHNNISNDSRFSIELYYNGGNPQLKYVEGNDVTLIPLVRPKKPEDTVSLLVKENANTAGLNEVRAVVRYLLNLLEKEE
jgi:hypothetical protein